jgi:hypothetical protein
MLPRLAAVIGLTVCVGLAGVSCVSYGKGTLAREWSASMRELQINPIFPPREDVRVGDVYLAPGGRGGDEVDPQRFSRRRGYLPIELLVESLDLSAQLSAYYTQRDSYPPTATSVLLGGVGLEASEAEHVLQPTAPEGKDVFASGDVGRLRIVGAPDFMTATYSEGGVSALIPVEAMSLGVAGAMARADSVKMSVPVAESYGLPASRVLGSPALSEFLRGPNLPLLFEEPGEWGWDEDRGEWRRQLGWVKVITEVYSTRVIDISIQSASSRGLGLAVRPVISPSIAGAGETAGATPDAPAPPAPAPDADDAGGDADDADADGDGEDAADTGEAPREIADVRAAPVAATPSLPLDEGADQKSPFEAARELNDALAESMADNTPGGSFRFVSAGNSAVSMRRTFERPIAIGYRGLSLRIVQTEDERGRRRIEATSATITEQMNPTMRSDKPALTPSEADTFDDD